MDAGAVNGQVLCPYCKIPMDYISETERMSGEVRITRYYTCPACRRKYIVERIIIERNGDVVTVKILDYDVNGAPSARPMLPVPVASRGHRRGRGGYRQPARR